MPKKFYNKRQLKQLKNPSSEKQTPFFNRVINLYDSDQSMLDETITTNN